MAGYYHTFFKKLIQCGSSSNQFRKSQVILCVVWRVSTYEAAKALLCGALVLAVPIFTCPFRWEVDVGVLGAEAVLLLEDKHRNDHLIWCFSEKFKKTSAALQYHRKGGLSITLKYTMDQDLCLLLLFSWPHPACFSILDAKQQWEANVLDLVLQLRDFLQGFRI